MSNTKKVDIEKVVEFAGMGQWQASLVELGDAQHIEIVGFDDSEVDDVIILELALEAAVASLQALEAICSQLFEHRM